MLIVFVCNLHSYFAQSASPHLDRSIIMQCRTLSHHIIIKQKQNQRMVENLYQRGGRSALRDCVSSSDGDEISIEPLRSEYCRTVPNIPISILVLGEKRNKNDLISSQKATDGFGPDKHALVLSAGSESVRGFFISI